MTHLNYYTSADGPGDDATWSLYSELYAHPDNDEPIDGSQTLVESGFPNMLAAEARATELYIQAHPDSPTARLEYLRGELRAERISQGELIELQGLAEHIKPGDVELLEAAGVPEHEEEPARYLTITAVVRDPDENHLDLSDVDPTLLRALITDDETMFVSLRGGVTQGALDLGADPDGWGAR